MTNFWSFTVAATKTCKAIAFRLRVCRDS